MASRGGVVGQSSRDGSRQFSRGLANAALKLTGTIGLGEGSTIPGYNTSKKKRRRCTINPGINNENDEKVMNQEMKDEQIKYDEMMSKQRTNSLRHRNSKKTKNDMKVNKNVPVSSMWLNQKS